MARSGARIGLIAHGSAPGAADEMRAAEMCGTASIPRSTISELVARARCTLADELPINPKPGPSSRAGCFLDGSSVYRCLVAIPLNVSAYPPT